MKMIKKFFREMFRFIGALVALVRGIMVIGMLVVGAATAFLIYTTANVTISQYNETLTWKNTAYETSLSEIEPTLVSNVVDTDIVTAAAAWETLDSYVRNLEQEPPEREAAQAVLDEAVKWQEKYGLESDAIDRLSLYLEMEEAVSEAYASLDTSRLKELSQQLYVLEMQEQTSAGQYYMDRMKEVASDFIKVQDVMANVIGSVGTLQNGVWTIPYTYTRTELAGALEQIKTMDRFPALGSTAAILSDVADVLNSNKSAREYFEYQEFSAQVAGLSQSDYVAVSSVYTYDQALRYGFTVTPQYAEGFAIDESSPVTGVYYNGERLASHRYVRKGSSKVVVEISEVYVPVQEPEQVTGYEEGDVYYE